MRTSNTEVAVKSHSVIRRLAISFMIAGGLLLLTSCQGLSGSAKGGSPTGTAPSSHTVDLTWDYSSGADSYNIYRGTVSGGPYTRINTSPDTTTTYTDSTVVSGQTYYYVTTAVDASSQESGFSNQAEAVIPNP
jgi:fibronectin type 3 domain-containing protein